MTRPTDAEVADALWELGGLAADHGFDVHQDALNVVRAAVVLPVPMPSKEFAELIGVHPANLHPDRTPGLPGPAVTYPRPTVARPGQVVRLWWRHDGVAFNEAKGGQ